MPDTLPNLNLPVLSPSQSQKHVTHNEALRILDILTQLSVVSDTQDTPPPVPVTGERYLVPASGVNAWAGQDNKIACFDQNAWVFFDPKPGWRVFVLDKGNLQVFDGASWKLVGGDLLESMAGIGIGMDTVSAPFSAKLNAALWTALYAADGGTGGISQTLNKETTADDAGLIFQTNFATRALLGLFGTDDLRLSVTENGSDFSDGLIINSATGIVEQPNLPRFSGTTNFDNFGDADVWVKIAINDLSYNDQAVFDPSSNQFTAPVDGLYHFGGHLLFKLDTNGGAQLNGRLVKNGSTPLPGSAGQVSGTHADGLTFMNTQATVPLLAGDTVELQGRYAAFSGYFQADETSFWGYKIG